MAESSRSPEATDDLQFSSAEPADQDAPETTPGLRCLACGQPIAGAYYALADKVLCPSCCEQVMAPPAGYKLSRFARATLFGVGAALVGALIWFVIRRVTNAEWGLVALLVGFIVGKAVRAGSRNQGGLAYQFLAVALTYFGIAANYVPDVFKAGLDSFRNDRAAMAANEKAGDDRPGGNQMKDGGKAAAAGELSFIGMIVLFVVALALSLALPFLAGVENFIGLLIIGFALWEAWKFNARVKLPISGPYQVGAQPVA